MPARGVTVGLASRLVLALVLREGGRLDGEAAAGDGWALFASVEGEEREECWRSNDRGGGDEREVGWCGAACKAAEDMS